MDEITKALGPFPVLQLVFGVLILGLGIFSVYRGLSGKEQTGKMEDRRAQWDAYRQLESIEQDHKRLVSLLERNNELTLQLLEAINRWGSFFFNKGQL